MRMNKTEFLEFFKNMEPMKYYEGVVNSPKGADMLNNKNQEYTAMIKHDGEWCRAIITEDGVILQSRSISKVTGTYGDKTEHVPHIVEELKSIYPAGTVIIGELCFDRLESTSKDVGSILRCLPPKAIERQKSEKLHFKFFDVLAYKYEVIMEKPFIERFRAIGVTELNRFVERVWFDEGDGANFHNMVDWVWKQGGEGIVIVRNDMKYAPGKRTAWQSLKVKKKLGALKAKVIGFIEPNKHYNGSEEFNWSYWVDGNDRRIEKDGIVNMKLYEGLQPVTKPYYFGWKNGVRVEYEGRIIDVTSGLTDEVREWLATGAAKASLEAGELFAEITGMEITADSIRHPVFLRIL